MKKYVVLAVMLLLSFSAFGQENKTVNLNFGNKFKFEKANKSYDNEQIQSISFNGKEVVSYSEKAGSPKIPWVSVNISVPNGAVFLDAKIVKNGLIQHKNTTIEAVQTIIPTNFSGSVDYIYPNYKSQKQDIYPNKNVRFIGSGKLSNYTMFNFLVSPFDYNLKTNNLVEIQNISIKLTYKIGKDIGNVQSWDDGDFHEIVKNIVVNKSDVPSPKRRVARKSDVKHLIITSNVLKDAFQVLANHRTANGLASEVITTETIYSTYSGATNQLKIKNCIKDYYETKGLKWVVLGGDDTIVPDQNVYGAVNGTDYEDYTMPADLFYACFDNQFDWNATNDDKVGNTDDNVDLLPEVFLGRIPVRTTSHVTAYINKMIDYEVNAPTSIAHKFLMTGCELWTSVGSVSDGEAKSEKMWNEFIADNWEGTKYRLYDTNSDFSGGAGYDLTPTHLQDQIDDGYGFVHMATHGNQQIWGMESGGTYSSNNALAQSNTKMGIVVTMACITNAFDCDATATSSNCNGGPYLNEPSLSEAFLRNPNGGAVGYLGSSRYGWGDGSGTADPGVSLQYNQEFFYKLFTGEGQTTETSKRFGAVSALTKIEYISASSSNGAYRWIMYTLNTMGDPALKVITDRDLSCTITSPSNGASYEIGSIIPISADATDYQNKSVSKVSFYSNGTLLAEDTSEPYSYNWNTTGLEMNNYIIKAVVIDNDGNLVEDEVTISLSSTIFVDDFESSTGWVLTGEFEIDAPQGKGGEHGQPDPSSAYEGTKILGVDLTGLGTYPGDYEADLTSKEYTAISPIINCSEYENVSFEFQKYLNVEQPSYDHAYIDISNDNGVNWTEIYSNTATVEDAAWSLSSYDISSYADGKSIQIRFSMGETDNGWYYSGWNIDNFKITGKYIGSGVENNLVNKFSLDQNYPNPFNPETVINFNLDKISEVKLTVFNIKGQLLQSLVNTNLSAGAHSVKFNAVAFNSGVYYYTLETPTQKITKKMLLVK